MTAAGDMGGPLRQVLVGDDEPDALATERPPLTDCPILRDDCPVKPLGVLGKISYYLDPLGQLRALKPDEHGRTGILSLFGDRQSWLFETYPEMREVRDAEGRKTGKWEPVPGGWRPGPASQDLIAAAASKRVWDPVRRVRGQGAWLGDNGELIYHCGDCLWVNGEIILPGPYQQSVYPAAPPGARPLSDPPDSRRVAGGVDGPASHLEKIFRTWTWSRPDVAPRLLLGWVCAALIGGALDYRPAMWLTGEQGTGKTTLENILGRVLTDVIESSDVTAAGIWQTIGQSSLPVALDEVEASDDNRPLNAVIKFARQAVSGGQVLRGGADHASTRFRARNAFLFSSILIPALTPQDRSRIVVLDLDLLTGTRPPELVPSAARDLGCGLRRRLAIMWPHWPARLDAWKQALVSVGHRGRGADAFGVALAAADLALSDHDPHADELADWADRLRPDQVQEDEDLKDWRQCLDHLLTSLVDAYRGGLRRSVAHYVRAAMELNCVDNEIDPPEAVEILAMIGLKVLDGINVPAPGSPSDKWLLIAHRGQGIERVFEGTRWALGVHAQSIKRVPGGVNPPNAKRIGGAQVRVRAVPISVALPKGDGS
ncbi:MAG: hypothetical protein KDA49_18815 [Rhodospirillaceae bacterium]|nr:hypothetical protein [Rhodospirillaceae bacterium]